jgi:SAM-dependent methyltransferase
VTTPAELAMKPFSEACERNQGPLLEVLRATFAGRRKVLEVGSGTGQHAVYFSRHLPHLIWQPSDRATHLPGIRLWLEEAALSNLLPPLALDVNDDPWPQTGADAVFSANTLHIMSWGDAQVMFERLGAYLPPQGVLVIYGPFRYGRHHTSESNARFDATLRRRDPSSGIRDFEAVDVLARAQGLSLMTDVGMPAHNRTLVWSRVAHG